MPLQETYNFNPADYDWDGFHKTRNRTLFLDFITECEGAFHQKFHPCYANVFVANTTVLRMINACLNDGDKFIYGMESRDGEIDLEMNLEIESHSRYQTVYAIGSRLKDQEDEPVFLVSDDSFGNRQFALKYVPDNDTDDTVEDVPAPGTRGRPC